MSISRVVALSSAVAFATQVAFALLMLHWFTPQEVGEFSVISQIGFFWMTLALAQTPLSILANRHLPAHVAAQHAWRSSLMRAMGLLPLAALAVWLSHLSLWPALLWTLFLAVCQMGWMLAQSWTLRTGHGWQQAAIRVLPPLTAACTAGVGVALASVFGWSGSVLLGSALLGYAAGAVWLAPALRYGSSTALADSAGANHSGIRDSEPSDPRSASLRMAPHLGGCTVGYCYCVGVAALVWCTGDRLPHRLATCAGLCASSGSHGVGASGFGTEQCTRQPLGHTWVVGLKRVCMCSGSRRSRRFGAAHELAR